MAAGTTEGGARRFLARLKHLKRRTWVIMGAVAVLVIGGGSTAAVLLLKPDSAQAAPVTQTVAASLETLEKTVATSGTLTPAVQESVSFVASGTVTSIHVAAGETEIGLIEAGDQVELETDDGTQLFGIVGEVGRLPSTTSGSPAYPVSIDITGSTEGLFDGTGVTVTIIYERRSEVLTVPTSAVHRSGVSATVDVLRGGGVETVEVELGAIGNELTEIISGLDAGDTVVLADLTAAIDGGTESRSTSSGLAGLGGSGAGTGGSSYFGGGMPTGGAPTPPGGFGG